MNEATWAWVQVAQFVINLLILGGIGIWRLAIAERDITAKLHETVEEHKERSLRDMATLRENQGEMERWVLEQFVRREDMKAAIDQINLSLSDIRQRLDTRMDRIESKIDNLNLFNINSGKKST